MKKLLVILLVAVVVLVGAVVAIPFVVPTETLKAQLAQQVERATGRALAIDGPIEISVLPTLTVEAREVRFANAPDGGAEDMAQLAALQLELGLWPLLGGRVEVERFVLVDPEIHLEIDAGGRPNWQLTAGEPKPPAEPKPREPGAGGGAGQRTGLPISDLQLADMRLVNGTVTFSDARSGTAERVESVNLAIQLPDLQSRLEAEGSLLYKGATVDLDVTLEHPLALLDGGGSPVSLALETPSGELDFDGDLDTAGAPQATGALSLNVTSIRNLAAWLAEPLAVPGEGLQTLRINGELSGSADAVALRDASIAFDDITASGELTANLAGAVPKVEGRLDVGAVDLDPYLPPAADAGEAARDAGAPADATKATQPETGARSTQGETEESKPTGAAGTSAASGWSDAPIVLPPLDAAEVAFELTLESLRARGVTIGATALALTLQGGKLDARFEEMTLYGGHATGRLQVEIADGAPLVQKQFKLDGLQALPFLTDAAGFDRLEGTASAEVRLSSRGRSERALIENLDGHGRVEFRDGAIVGINLAAMVRNARSAFADPTAGEVRKTDFAELSGSFVIAHGILSNDDLVLQSPLLRVHGAGTVDLPGRLVDYRVEPKAAPTLEGQGGRQDVAGLLVPVIVAGPWDDLTFTPDLTAAVESALENPEATRQQIEKLTDQVKELDKGDLKGAAKGLLRGFLGKQ